jgi:hypothetical protein
MGENLSYALTHLGEASKVATDQFAIRLGIENGRWKPKYFIDYFIRTSVEVCRIRFILGSPWHGDYKPVDRGKYIEAFFSNVDWESVNRRLATPAALRAVA